MSLETGTYVADLNQSNPPGTDRKAQGDDHIRLVKSVLKGTFPNADKPFYFPTTLSKTALYQILEADHNALIECDASGGAFTISLPTLVAAQKGWQVWIRKKGGDANAITVDSDGGETIDTLTSIRLRRANQAALFIWNGSAWVSNRSLEIAEAVTKTSSATLAEHELDLVVVTTAGGSVTLGLPAASGLRGRVCRIKRLDATNSLIIDPNGAETIDGASTYTLSAIYDTIELFCTGAAWIILSRTDFADAKLANTWLLRQTFVKGVLNSLEAIASATTVTLDFSGPANKVVTVSHTMSLAASNIVDGLSGFIELVQGGGFVVTPTSDFVLIDGGMRIDTTAGISTRYSYRTIDGKIYLFKEYVEGKNSIGHYKEYDLGAVSLSNEYTQAHLLNKHPALVQVMLENTTTEFGYSVGQRIWDMKGDRHTADTGFVVWSDTTNVGITTSSTSVQIISRTSNLVVNITNSRWKFILRVYS